MIAVGGLVVVMVMVHIHIQAFAYTNPLSAFMTAGDLN